MRLKQHVFRHLAGAALAVVAIVLLAGPGSSPSDAATLLQRLFGGGKSDTTSPDALVVSPQEPTGPQYCPELRIVSGQQSLTTFDPSHQGDQNYIRYLSSISQTARQCLDVTEGVISMKIGVAGRVVAGPKGAPGKVTLPLRVTVIKQHGSVVLFNKAYSTTVMIAGGDLSVDFSQVIDPVTFKRTSLDEDFIVYVGFDTPKSDKG